MITAKQIQKLVEEKLEGSENYIVNIEVKPGNQITIEIDNNNGLNIDDCVDISRFVEGSLDREIQDFGLNVSSPGVGSPFRNELQYQKYLNKMVEVLTIEGVSIEGILLKKDVLSLELEVEKGKKGVKKDKEIVNISLLNIKETKSVISFK